jgi:hypothetical protein
VALESRLGYPCTSESSVITTTLTEYEPNRFTVVSGEWLLGGTLGGGGEGSNVDGMGAAPHPTPLPPQGGSASVCTSVL